jgi:hypothetical protein
MLLLLLLENVYLLVKLRSDEFLEVTQLHLALHAQVLSQYLQILHMLILQSVDLLDFLRD